VTPRLWTALGTATSTATDRLADTALPVVARLRELLSLRRGTQRGPGWHASLDPKLRSAFEAEHALLARLEPLHGVGSILSIGPGRGLLELALVSQYGLDLGYVEPHRESGADLERSFAAAGLADRIVERHRRKLESARLRLRYDLVLAVSSWYAFGQSRVLLRKALGARRPGGRLVISLASERDLLRSRLQGRPRITAESLSHWAARQGFAHRLERFQVPVPTRALVENGELSASGRAWLAFVAQRPWSEIPEDRRAEARRYVLERASEDTLPRDRAALVFGPDPSSR
jgi:SAM-dependent methyltransferase